MEEKRKYLFLLVLLLWLPYISAQDLRQQGYFNGSSELYLPFSINFSNLLSFSILTCSYGVFLHQEGPSGDTLEMAFQEETGYFKLSWRASGYSDHITLNRNFLDNIWHLIEIKPHLGRIIVMADGNLNRTIFDNSLTSLRNIVLQPPIKIGLGFRGCILQGSNLNFSTVSNSSNVQWNDCPLASYQNCGPLCRREENFCQNGGICRELDYSNYTSCQCPHHYTGSKCEYLIHDFCFSDPCKNGGSCSPNLYNDSYDCTCLRGFAGMNCELQINECDRHPCQNGGICEGNATGFTCNCSNTGYRGQLCDIDINECIERNPCLNGGSCLNVYGQYQCTCSMRYFGRNCEREVDICSSYPCRNGATCHIHDQGYGCICPNGFTGINCDMAFRTTCDESTTNDTCSCRPGYTGNWPNCVDINECSSNPCMNRGTCQNLENSFHCNCAQGFAGTFCNENIDECIFKPCQNGASCVDGIATYSCICNPGFTDKNCSTNINDCESTPCRNGATCIDLVNGFNCSCSPGWEGLVCDQDINECSSNPCHNGNCTNQLNDFKCTCLPGYTGKQCNIDINDCMSSPCLHGGTCVDLANNFTCNCTNEWMGKTCAERYNACALNSCYNNASCTSMPPSHDFTCVCLPGFTGASCEVNIDDCENVTCSNGTVCHDKINDHDCACPKGFHGELCQTEINECLSNPCHNNATCIDGTGFFNCTCKTGYTGILCESDINECDHDPCENGICQNSFGGYQCYCTPGFSGSTCSIDVNECLPNPCYNNATCNNQRNHYQCVCLPGYTGINCETDIDECSSSSCLNGGTCQDQVNGFKCHCVVGFTGLQCESDIDDCAPKPCNNGGLCLDKVNGYFCNCNNTGFNGTRCEYNIDDCIPNNCVNNGTCEDGIRDYSCTCYPGYSGKNCEHDIDECASHPCQYHSTCLQKSNQTLYEINYNKLFPHFNYEIAAGYVCICHPGLTGINCETDIDDCLSHPCQNGGICQDQLNAFNCICSAGYEGLHCEKEIDECNLYKPCRNNGSCEDLVADYKCQCTSKYGGKNCTVELLGCRNHVCQNDGVCIPYLIGEDIHNYTCDCLPGFYGFFCDVSTSVSFSGNSFAALQTSNLTPYVFSLMFKTTLRSGLLVTAANNIQNSYYTLELQNSAVRLQYNGDMILQVGSKLNDGEWHRIIVTFTSRSINLTLSSIVLTSDVKNFSEHRSLTFANTNLGGTPFSFQPLSSRIVSNFTGCLQDIFFGATLIQPQVIKASGINIEKDCNRIYQCQPDTCSRKGKCEDLWLHYACHCDRPFTGATCHESFIPGTFGYQNSLSYAIVHLNESHQNFEISMFIKTRQPNGLLLYWGDLPSPTNLTLYLSNGHLYIDIQLPNFSKVFFSSPKLNNGWYQFVELRHNGSSLIAAVNNSEVIETDINAAFNITSENLYIGGIPASLSNRTKRENPNILLAIPPFKGVIQDVRFNDKQVSFFGDNHNTFQHVAASLNNVQKGEVNEPKCDSNPCQNGGKCSLVWDDFVCTCPSGYKGKDCTKLAYCLNTGEERCPQNTTCRDLEEGHECLTAATFNGKTNIVVYNGSIASDIYIDSIKFRLRTRSLSGIIFHAPSFSTSISFLTLELLNGYFVIRYSVPDKYPSIVNVSATQHRNLSDGKWHNLSIGFNLKFLKVEIDDHSVSYREIAFALPFGRLVTNALIYIGGVTKVLLNNFTNFFIHKRSFEGCLDDIRIADFLLPLLPPDKYSLNKSLNQFFVHSINVDIGCHSQPACAKDTCLHGSVCNDIWNAYNCTCASGYTGYNCETNIDECKGNQCMNGATCIDGIATYTCNCIPGFTGKLCDENINECDLNLCDNNSTCTDLVNDFTCNCTGNFSGQYCNISIFTECKDNPCQNGAECVNMTITEPGDLQFKCSCAPGYTGYTCDLTIKYCGNNNCSNGATCLENHQNLNYTCHCAEGWEGSYCERDKDECEDNICENGATCNNTEGSYTCLCPEGWNGTNCTFDIDECLEQPCKNNGTCENTLGYFYCLCNGTDYTGAYCEEDINECKIDNPCLNNSTCTNLNGSYKCECTLGYEGKHCQIPNCNSVNCGNGTCNITAKSTWMCQCPPFYEGDFCEKINLCISSPCQNNGTCHGSAVNFTCICPPGYTGYLCEKEIDYCESNPCKNGATCKNANFSSQCVCPHGSVCSNQSSCSPLLYACICKDGFTGDDCEININECASNPCFHGICIDDINSYHCNCSNTGFTGDYCQTNIDECVERPCKHGGTCIDKVGFYECICAEGLIQPVCDLDPCYSNPCSNGGTCILVEKQKFKCECLPDYGDEHCSKKISNQFAGNNDEISIIVGVTVGGAFLLIMAGIIAFFMMARKKRATRGTYSPSRQEMFGSRVEMGHMMKPPPEERLI